MPRERNAMAIAEIATFLATAEWMALGVVDADGAPLAAAVPTLLDGDRLLFAVSPGSPAARALARDPRCCCAIDRFPSYYEIKGATVHGRATPLDPGPAAAAELAVRADRHGLPGGETYALPWREDAFGFDFAKLARAPPPEDEAIRASPSLRI